MGDQKRKLILILGWNLFATSSLILAIYLYGFFSEKFGQDNKKLIKSNAVRIIHTIKATKLARNDLEAYIQKMVENGAPLDIEEKFGRRFIKIDLNGINLAGANARGFIIKSAGFKFSKLNSIDMTEATLIKSIFDGAIMPSSLLNRAAIKKTSFNASDLSNASLINARLNSVSLVGANLSGANLSGAYLINVDLSGANLNNALLYNARLENVKMSNTDCTKVHLHNTIIKGSILNGSKFTDARITDNIFENNEMHDVDFTKADLRGTKWIKNQPNKLN